MKSYSFRSAVACILFLVTKSNYGPRWNVKRPDNSIFLIYYGQSFKGCLEVCIRYRTCGVLDYNRRFQQCRLSHRHTSTNHLSSHATGSVIMNKPLESYDDGVPGPVFNITQLPDCRRFTRNFDDVTIECVTHSKHKKLYVQQADGRISDHVTVFRAFNGDGIDVYDSWINRENITLLKTCNSPMSCDKHFRHYVVDELGTEFVKQVKYILKKDEEEVAFIVFDGQGHDLESWFNPDGISNTSWTGLADITNYSYFTMKGTVSGRRFYISTFNNSCLDGLFVTFVTTKNAFSCPYDIVTKSPQMSYCEKTVPCQGKDLKIADTLEIEWYF